MSGDCVSMVGECEWLDACVWVDGSCLVDGWSSVCGRSRGKKGTGIRGHSHIYFSRARSYARLITSSIICMYINQHNSVIVDGRDCVYTDMSGPRRPWLMRRSMKVCMHPAWEELY